MNNKQTKKQNLHVCIKSSRNNKETKCMKSSHNNKETKSTCAESSHNNKQRNKIYTDKKFME